MAGLARRDALRLLGCAGVAAALGELAGCADHPSGPAATGAPSAGASATTVAPTAVPVDWSALAAALRGPLVRPGAADYSGAARLYNPRFDTTSRPAAIARCADAADVQACVRFAADTRSPFAIRSGGHSYGGWSTSAGLVVDVSAIDAVSVDTAAGTARVGCGALLVDVYAALAAKGVAVAAGSCPTVGMTGLTLGGGVGVLTRAWGLTCDAVTGVEIVTADGRLRQIDANTDADLFWAVRGGGGGFGAVTAWTIRTRPAPTVHTFYLAYDFARAAQVLSAWQHWAPQTDTRLWTTCKLLGDPGQGTLRATVSGTWIGPAGQLDGQLAPLLAQTGSPSSRSTNTLGYGQAMLLEAGCYGQDPASCKAAALGAAKRQPFAATSSIASAQLPAAAIAAAVAHTRAAMDVPHLVEGGVSFDVLGGAVAAVASDATAFPHRTALATVQYTATWLDGGTPADPFDAYVRGFRAAMAPWLGNSAYANYADATIEAYGPAYWGGNYPRLQQVKHAVDPASLFASGQSVRATTA